MTLVFIVFSRKLYLRKKDYSQEQPTRQDKQACQIKKQRQRKSRRVTQRLFKSLTAGRECKQWLWRKAWLTKARHFGQYFRGENGRISLFRQCHENSTPFLQKIGYITHFCKHCRLLPSRFTLLIYIYIYELYVSHKYQ